MPNNSAPTCFRDPQAVWPDPINPVLVYNIAKIVNNPLGKRRQITVTFLFITMVYDCHTVDSGVRSRFSASWTLPCRKN